MPYCALGHVAPYGAKVCPECGVTVALVEPAGPGEGMGPGRRRPVERVTFLTSGLRRGADYLEMGSVIAAVLGVIGGGVVAAQTTRDGYGSDHPYVVLGLVIMASSIFSGLFNWCVARALHVYAEHTALSYSVDLDDPPSDGDDGPPAAPRAPVPSDGRRRVRVRPRPGGPRG